MVKTFWLVLTYNCNNRCNYCYAKSNNEQQYVSMSISYAQNIIDAMIIAKAKTCLLIGGEPTLYPDLDKIIAYVKNKFESKIKINLITNGRKLSSNEYLSKLVDAGLERVVISIEGSSAKAHNFIAQTESYYETVEGIKNCVNANLLVTSLTTINRYNKNDLSNIVQLTSDLGVHNVSFNCAIPSVNRKKIDASFTLSPQEVAKKIENIYCLSKSQGIKTHFNLTIPICLIEENILEQMIDDNVVAVGCQMYHGKGVAFDPVGNILPCTHFADFPIISLQNQIDLQKDFTSIWQKDDEVCQFREELWRYPSPKCHECKYWGGCVGGCPLLWSFYDPLKII